MRRAISEPPAAADASPNPRAPAWLEDVVTPRSVRAARPTAERCAAEPAAAASSARSPAATLIQSGAPRAPAPAGAGLVDRMNIGAEAPGRYVYMTPDGDAGAELGRGGIGRVLIALDEQLGREVALKELLSESVHDDADPELMARFLAEARITGQLEHPNIVPVYELGRRLDGRLYYTMRVVRGETMSAALQRAGSLAERLALLPHFAGLCHAIEYAHSRGVVHRDIKPDNVMIGEFGETIVLDWGIAKVKGQPETSRGRVPRHVTCIAETSHGDLVGTPLFMSPEQASGDIDQVDEASDVWSLGVVLYMLLAGRPPFVGRTTEELVRQITHGRAVRVRGVAPLAPVELCAVVERALCRDKAARYASVRQLVQDVEAFMSGARVAVYEYSALDLARRFYRRHRAATLVFVVALLALLGVATELQRRILAARDRALLAEQTALEKERVARASLSEVFTERALNASAQGDVVGAELYAARALASGERPDARGSIVALTSRHELTPTRDDASFAGCAALAQSGRGEVACARDGAIALFAPGRGVSRIDVDERVARLALSADASTLLAGFSDGRFVVYDAPSGAPRYQFRTESRLPRGVGLSVSGQRFLTLSDGWVQLWDTASAQRIARLQLGQQVASWAFSPAGVVALGGRLGALVLWHPKSGDRSELEGHRGTVTALAFSRRGELLASAASDHTLSIWNALTGQRLAAPLGEIGSVQSLAWGPDGTRLVFGSDDRMLGIVDARHARQAERVRGHCGPVLLASFAGDDAIVSVGSQRGLRLWSYRRPAVPRELSHKSNVLAQAFVGPDRLASAGLASEGVCLWSIRDERCSTHLPVRDGQVRALGVHAGTGRLGVGTSLGQLTIWNLATTLPEHVFGIGGQVRSVEFSPDGNWLAAGSSDGSVRLWNLGAGAQERSLQARAAVNDVIFDFDRARSRLIAATRAGALEVWGLDGQRLRVLPAHGDWVMDLALHAGSGRLVSLGGDGEIVFWSLPRLTRLGSARAHEGRALSADFDPSGELVASGGEDGRVHVWDAQRRQRIAELVHHRGAVRSVRFSADGKVLASGGDDGSVRLWDLRRLRESGEVLLARAEAASGVRSSGVSLELVTE